MSRSTWARSSRYCPSLDIKPDVVVLDPPRAGLDPYAMEGLIKAAPGQIIYISCDPATLARDLQKLIAAGYTLESVTPFDLFPQTFHIESISVLKKMVSQDIPGIS